MINLISASTNHLMRYSIPIYELKTKKNSNGYYPDQVCTCSIIKYCNRLFIITAGHVFADKVSSDFCFGIVEEFLLEEKVLNYVNNEVLDIAIIEISTTIANKIIGSVFDIIDFDNNKFSIKASVYCGKFDLIGFPYRKCKYDFKKNKVIPKLKKITTYFAKESDFITDYKFAVIYDRNNIFYKHQKIYKGFLPGGMSGSPVWYRNQTVINQQEFAGVAIEYSKEKKCIIVVRAETIIDCVDKITNKSSV